MRKRLSRALILLPGALAFLFASVPIPVEAQTPFIPYYGKNRVRHKNFEWYIYRTDHFEIFYYPDLEPHLERIASYAESAYQRISGELKQDLPNRVPLILFKTQAEFQMENVSGGEVPEGVLAFAEPERYRMVLPIDEPPDQLYRLITHELTHVFEFEIIPRGIMGANLPLWMDEGLSNYMASYWNVLDLMQVRDAALTDNVPKMSDFRAMPLSGRLPYSLGHAAFEFIESKWGKEGIRQFLFSLRKSVIGGGESAYEEALKVKPEEFDDMFDRYLKERFRPFRDKERPADYGRNIAPNPERTRYVSVLSVEPTPSGDMLAAVVGNRKDQELDIILISSKDGQIIRNVTNGFDKDRGFEYIATAGGLRGNLVPWVSLSQDDRIAYFARTGKGKSLVIENVVTGRQERKLDLASIDAPESPAFSPDGKRLAFAGIQGAVTDIYVVDLASGAITNVTKDSYADYSPTFSPDGRALVYAARIAGNDKLFHLDLASGGRKQLTFGAHDDTAARFVDDNTIVFTSTALDPNLQISQEQVRNASIPNIWTLDLRSGELKQWTDTLTGIVSPVVLPGGSGLRIAFVSYYKGENGIHVVTFEQPKVTATTADFGEAIPNPPDFTPPLGHTLVRDNIHRKGTFEKMTLAGRPPVGLGVTSSGNFYGNTELTFTDVLGDKQFNFYAQSIGNYRTMALTYVNIEKRLQYALQGFSQDIFYFGQNPALYDPSLAPYIDRDQAEAVQSQKGATAFGIYPLSRYSRLELFGGYSNVSERFANGGLQQLAEQYQTDRFGNPLFRNGHMLPLGISFVQETTVFREYGPVAGSTMKVSFDASPGFNRANWLSRRTLDGDFRHYVRMAWNGVLAMRLRGFKSWGRNPDFLYFGGNSEMRGYEYLEFLGHNSVFANAELRFPLIEAMLTPVGVLGGLRGVLFFNIGGASFNGQSFRFASTGSEIYSPIINYQVIDFFGSLAPVYADPIRIDGLRLVDGRASYGLGLESFVLGFPMHFDWSWKTLFNRQWEDALFAFQGRLNESSGSEWFRKMKFSFWIGYDF